MNIKDFKFLQDNYFQEDSFNELYKFPKHPKTPEEAVKMCEEFEVYQNHDFNYDTNEWDRTDLYTQFMSEAKTDKECLARFGVQSHAFVDILEKKCEHLTNLVHHAMYIVAEQDKELKKSQKVLDTVVKHFADEKYGEGVK